MNAATQKPRGKPINVEYREIGIPTSERIMKSGGAFDIGDDKQGTRVYRFHDNPLEKMLGKKQITGSEFAALSKYFHHWHHAGLEASLGSVDLNRIFSSDPGSMSGMAKSERQAFHRKLYREARELIGHQTGIVIDNVVCAGHTLEVAGYSIGYRSPFRAREAALGHIKRGADILERHWG